MSRWTENDLAELLKNSSARIHQDKPIPAQQMLQEPKKKTSKYNNTRTKIDGILFDSAKEADYYSQLKVLYQAGALQSFCRQPEIILQEGFAETRPIIYKPDFLVVTSEGHAFYVDVKGLKTDVYKMKKKMLLKKFPNIDFREV